MSIEKVSKLEIELLMIFYNLSDQYGNVNIVKAKKWASDKLGIEIPNKPFTLQQKHFNILMDSGAIPDTRDMLNFIAARPYQKDPKSRRRPRPREQS